uniref:Uncharacterized protein n=1 Tax=Musa acuminata subsp. malaccensis TaxID=214687 RepID=A0A804JJB7_MUSAM
MSFHRSLKTQLVLRVQNGSNHWPIVWLLL